MYMYICISRSTSYFYPIGGVEMGLLCSDLSLQRDKILETSKPFSNTLIYLCTPIKIAIQKIKILIENSANKRL